MAGRLLEDDPELAYQHAQAAVRRAGRVDVVREAAGITAYRTGRYAEALRELRTVRRLSGSAEHLPVMADCERGLGRPERAIALGKDEGVASLDKAATVELAMVIAGARMDLDDPEGALVALNAPVVRQATGELAQRVAEVRSDALEAAGRAEEAARLRATVPAEEDDLVLIDLDEDDDEPAADLADDQDVPTDETDDDEPATGDDDAPAGGGTA